MSSGSATACHARIRGFTLVEVLVAFAILAFTLAAAYGVFSNVSRSIASGERYGQALALAESRLAAVDAAPPDQPWDDAGEFDGGLDWRVQTAALPGQLPESIPVVPVIVSVTVTWDGGGPVVLETIRLRAR